MSLSLLCSKRGVLREGFTDVLCGFDVGMAQVYYVGPVALLFPFGPAYFFSFETNTSKPDLCFKALFHSFEDVE